MDGLLNLLPLYIDDAARELDLNHFLETCQVHKSFDHKHEDEVEQAVGRINSMLNNVETRVEGAMLLDTLVPQCHTELFTSNVVSWVQQVMHMLQGPSRTEGGTTACLVLQKLLAFASQFPEVSRQLSTTVVSQLVHLLCDSELQSQAAIERHLLSVVDWDEMVPEGSLQASWSECLTLLPSLGGSGTGGVQHKTNWIELCSQILQSVHGSINVLFANVEEMQSYEVSQVMSLKSPELKHSNPMVLLHLHRRRFINLCSALASLFREPFAASKNIPVDEVLEMVSRLLALNSKSLSKTARANFEQLTLASIIPDLHSAALNVLTVLVGVCRIQLVPRASIIMNMYIQVLQWTFTPFDERLVATERPYGKLRVQVYESLVRWLAASRSACGLAKSADVLLSQLLSDVIVQRDKVKLIAAHQPPNGGSNGNQSGRKKKKHFQQTDVILHKTDYRANADVCQAALECLSTLILYCGPRISSAAHKETQEVVLSILIDIANGAELKGLLPYNDSRCRAALYRVLEKLILCPNPHWPAPLNYAAAVFNSGLSDPNLEVSLVCTHALVSIQSILRPRGPTLNFALDIKQMRSVRDESKLPDTLAPVSSNGSPAPLLADVAPPSIPVNRPIAAEVTVATDAVSDTRQTEEPSDRPERIAPMNLKAIEVDRSEEFLTPPSGVTTLNLSPPEELPKMSRKEALVLISDANVMHIGESLNDPPNSNAPLRKRPLPEPKTGQPHEKVLKELPFGADSVDDDDDLDSMLATFRDIPPE